MTLRDVTATPRLLDKARSSTPRRWHCRALRGLRCRRSFAAHPAAIPSIRFRSPPFKREYEQLNKHLAINLSLLSPAHRHTACVISGRWASYACLAFLFFLIVSAQVDARSIIGNAAVAGGVPVPSTALAERSLAR